jgi:hypothetical protein
MEKLVVILVFAAIAIINKALRKGDTTDVPDGGSPPFTPETPTVPVRRLKADQTEEERVRKFMEALGVPPGSVVQPRKIVRPSQPVRRVQPQVKIEVPLPVVTPQTPTPPPVPAQPVAGVSQYGESGSFRAVSPQEAQAAVAQPANIATAPVGKDALLSTGSTSVPAIDLRALLESPASIRTAFVLREILGPPRSLHSFSEAPSFH